MAGIQFPCNRIQCLDAQITALGQVLTQQVVIPDNALLPGAMLVCKEYL